MDQASEIEIIRIIALLVAAVITMAALVVITVFLKAPKEATLIVRALVQTGSLIRMITIFGIVMAIVTLRWRDLITGDAAIGSIGSIAGYVLGRGQRHDVGSEAT